MDGKIITKIITKDENIHQEIALIDAIRYIHKNIDEYVKNNEHFEDAYIESQNFRDFTGKGK